MAELFSSSLPFWALWPSERSDLSWVALSSWEPACFAPKAQQLLLVFFASPDVFGFPGISGILCAEGASGGSSGILRDEGAGSSGILRTEGAVSSITAGSS